MTQHCSTDIEVSCQNKNSFDSRNVASHTKHFIFLINWACSVLLMRVDKNIFIFSVSMNVFLFVTACMTHDEPRCFWSILILKRNWINFYWLLIWHLRNQMFFMYFLSASFLKIQTKLDNLTPKNLLARHLQIAINNVCFMVE